jgi:hypothetical protein
MPQGNMNAAQLQKQMAKGTKNAYERDFNVGYLKDIDDIIKLQRQNQEIPEPRRNREFVNLPDGDEVMAFSTKTRRDERIDNSGEQAATRLNKSRVAAQNASGRPPRKKLSVAKPLSAATGAKMVSAMSGKSNGTFAGGSPRSSMSKNLKIK